MYVLLKKKACSCLKPQQKWMCGHLEPYWKPHTHTLNTALYPYFRSAAWLGSLFWPSPLCCSLSSMLSLKVSGCLGETQSSDRAAQWACDRAKERSLLTELLQLQPQSEQRDKECKYRAMKLFSTHLLPASEHCMLSFLPLTCCLLSSLQNICK